MVLELVPSQTKIHSIVNHETIIERMLSAWCRFLISLLERVFFVFFKGLEVCDIA